MEKTGVIGMRLYNVYDNVPLEPGFETGFGFACVVEKGKNKILFDTGGSEAVLLPNLKTAGINPREIEAVVISHNHWDHTGGLSVFLDENPEAKVYLPSSFQGSHFRKIKNAVKVVDRKEILPGVHSTGTLEGRVPEQSLVIESKHGLIVLTGCAHPGIVRIIQTAKEQREGKIYLALGGFHLNALGHSEIKKVIAEFRRLGVQKAAPSHCTGEEAVEAFFGEYGEDCIQAGAGKIIEI